MVSKTLTFLGKNPWENSKNPPDPSKSSKETLTIPAPPFLGPPAWKSVKKAQLALLHARCYDAPS